LIFRIEAPSFRDAFNEAKKTIKNFSCADFHGMWLDEINFSGLNLTGANFDDTLITDCVFSNSIMQGVSFHDALLKKCKFKSVDITYGDLGSAVFNGCEADNVDFSTCNFYRCQLHDTIFQDCVLPEKQKPVVFKVMNLLDFVRGR
jgi:uncharacterized protein YjbI with pentapeptide repeats